MPQRLYSVLKPVSALLGRKNTPQISHLPVIACTQRPHSVPTGSTRRLFSVNDASTPRKKFLQRVHGALTAHSQRAYSVLMVTIAFKNLFMILYFEQPYLANIVIYFDLLRSNSSLYLTVVKTLKVTQDLQHI